MAGGVGHMGGLTNPRPWRGRCRAGFSNTFTKKTDPACQQQKLINILVHIFAGCQCSVLDYGMMPRDPFTRQNFITLFGTQYVYKWLITQAMAYWVTTNIVKNDHLIMARAFLVSWWKTANCCLSKQYFVNVL